MHIRGSRNRRSSGLSTGHRWAVVLAGGEGTRLQPLTSLGRGTAVPKQFCSLRGGPSLLRQALRRAANVASPERTVVVVAADHRRWWERELLHLPRANIVVQPRNRGTAAGILLPLLRVFDRDPKARLLLIPSDHYVADERTLAHAAGRALERAATRDRIVLLGISPDAPETGFGWIVPGSERHGDLSSVARFVEKPGRRVAARLLRQGALWNSFLFAVRAVHLVDCFRQTLPGLTAALESRAAVATDRASSAQLLQIYAELPVLDFSRDLLASPGVRLEVLRVPRCGWSDLGTPERVAECLRRARPRTVLRRMTSLPIAPLDLSHAHRRLASSV